MGFNPFKEAEKKAKSAVNSVIDKTLKPAIRNAEKKANSVTSNIDRKGKQVINSVDGKLDDLTDAAIDRMKDAANDVENSFTEKLPELVTEQLPDLIEEVAKELAEQAVKGAIKEALETACNVIEFMAPTRYTIVFGVELAFVVQGEVTVAATFPNPVAKLTEVRKWAKKPPNNRKQIVECIKDFGPESLVVEFKVSGNGGAVEWDGEDKYDRIDTFLEKHGVN